MSDNTVEITESSSYSITIDTNLAQNNNGIIIETLSPNTIEIIDHNIILVSDLPQGYPLDWTIGNLPISRVSGLDIIGGSGIAIDNDGGIYTIAVTGSFGLTGEEVDDRVGSLLGAGSYISLNYNDSLDSLNISVTGLQPSGIYASGVHTHSSSDITNFNSSVSGLLPVKNIISGSGILVNNNEGNFTVAVTGSFGLTSEQVDDRVNDLLKAGSYVNINYNDNLDSLTVNVTGLQPSGSYAPLIHSHLSSDITDFNSSVSGLIPPSNFTSLVGISGVFVSNSGTNYIVSLIDPTTQLTDITDLSVDARLFLSTPSSYNLQSLITNETGSGLLVFNDSPSFSGIPTAPTASSGTNSTQIANTSFVRTEISNLINSAPSTLDTLKELAIALGNDPNFATTIASGLGQKANLSGATFAGTVSAPSGVFNNLLVGVNETSFTVKNDGSVSIPGGSGNFAGLKVNGVNVSVSGHSHSSNDITNFNTSVSGLLPSVTGSGYVTSSFNNNFYTISVSGLQPSGNYANSAHTHSYTDIIDFGSGIDTTVSTLLVAGNYINLNYDNLADTLTISASGLQPSGNYANSVHSHGNISSSGTIGSSSGLLVTTTSGGALTTSSTINSSYISNFNSSVSGILPSVTGSGYVNSVFNNNIYTINVSGLQPSGNYSTIGHNHVTSEITDFNTSVSGLIPIKNIIAGTGISLTNNSGNYTITSSGSGIIADRSKSLVTTVFNKTGNPIPKFSVVYINGGQGDQPTVALAIASGEITSSKTYGITAEVINNMDIGTVIVNGSLTGVDTDQFNPTAPVGDVNGTTLWLSYSTPGGVTTVKPSAPNHMVAIGTIVRTHQNEGVVEVRIQNGFELEELHNVAISGVVAGQFIQYNSNGLWVPTSSGNFSTLQLNGINVSTSGHTHGISDISNFTSTVSGLLPVTNILAGSNIGVSSSGSIFTVAVTGQLGLTTEEVDDRVASLLVAGTGIDLTYNDSLNALVITSVGSSPSGNYALVGHTHTSSSITDFNSSVSGLLPITNIVGGSNVSVTQSGTIFTVAVTGSLGLTTEEVDDRVASLLVAGNGINLNYDDNTNTLTINTSGLQPSGNYSLTGHTHSSSDISNFNTSVSGLLPVTNITAGSGISISSTSGNFTINAVQNIINGSNLYLWSNFR